jgi:hypothetical protein
MPFIVLAMPWKSIARVTYHAVLNGLQYLGLPFIVLLGHNGFKIHE